MCRSTLCSGFLSHIPGYSWLFPVIPRFTHPEVYPAQRPLCASRTLITVDRRAGMRAQDARMTSNPGMSRMLSTRRREGSQSSCSGRSSSRYPIFLLFSRGSRSNSAREDIGMDTLLSSRELRSAAARLLSPPLSPEPRPAAPRHAARTGHQYGVCRVYPGGWCIPQGV